MASKEAQVAEFQSLFVKAYQIYMKSPGGRSLLDVFANVAYGGVPQVEEPTPAAAVEEKEAEADLTTKEAVEETPEAEEVKEGQMTPQKSPQKSPRRSPRVSPGGDSSINFGDDSIASVRSSTRVRQPAGGASSIVFGGGEAEAAKPSTRVRVAPGGHSSVQLGGPHLAKDQTRKKKKPEVPTLNHKELPTPRQMAASEQKSSVFEAHKTSPTDNALSPDVNDVLVKAIRKFPKLKEAYQEFVGDSSGKLVTEDSFKNACSRLGVTVSDEYVDAVFAEFQKKGNFGFSSFVRFTSKISN
mmetsp:Transcript_1635/g.2042  ORF Transcript_1635/g.2042 Transcript_1635/m.2042 type:complete len:299 (+) Transcript_1635:73-969(+)|eukprot:jgi/Bigna1/88965/estExt_fgenesh1_pg.C_410083